jgi:hypothetical protein
MIDSGILKLITGNDTLYSRKIGESGKKLKFSCVDFPNGKKRIVLHEILDSKL